MFHAGQKHVRGKTKTQRGDNITKWFTSILVLVLRLARGCRPNVSDVVQNGRETTTLNQEPPFEFHSM